ncbi:hypothetical protein JW926_04565 [Candidatus Sumerlaeota bacterium]|nr:hypothetical protein [Candidatus Sumerlaeota bacterium]
MNNNKKSLDEWADIISVLDNEIPRTTENREDFRLLHHSERWSPKLLSEYINEYIEDLKNILSDPDKLDEIIGNFWKPQNNNKPRINNSGGDFRKFLENALEIAMELSEPYNSRKKLNAGAIYLYDDQYDELVMVSSKGFPLNCNDDKFRQQAILAYKKKNEDKIAENLTSNLDKLKYIRDKLRPIAANKVMQRDPWLREELRGGYEQKNGNLDLDNLDCNELLIGIAYYIPGSGITGQLFDKDKGPELERIPLTEGNFKENFKKGLKSVSGELQKHLIDELLYKRTIVFKRRDDMAAGRQVQAGYYEGLQFADSKFIGPFLGTVLRFNGEHFGILKVERPQIDINKASNKKFNLFNCKLELKNKETPDNKRKRRVEPYQEVEIRRFLLFSYILSGILYILKYHYGKDLREAWTSLSIQGSKV